MAATEGFAAFSTTGPPYGVVLTTTGDTTTVSVIVYEHDTAVRGVVINESAPAVEWARTELEQLKREATEVTADLDALSAAVTDGVPELHSAETGTAQRSPGRGPPLRTPWGTPFRSPSKRKDSCASRRSTSTLTDGLHRR